MTMKEGFLGLNNLAADIALSLSSVARFVKFLATHMFISLSNVSFVVLSISAIKRI